ncbi:MAG: hypothetical protein ACK58N_18010 [Synechocystis sp.]
MFALQGFPRAIGQNLIKLVHHPPRNFALPLAGLTRLRMGLNADFFVVATERRVNEERRV